MRNIDNKRIMFFNFYGSSAVVLLSKIILDVLFNNEIVSIVLPLTLAVILGAILTKIYYAPYEIGKHDKGYYYDEGDYEH